MIIEKALEETSQLDNLSMDYTADVIIPTYNEPKLSEVIRDMLVLPFVKRIIVVDDGSNYFILDKKLISERVKVVRIKHIGKTRAVLRGVEEVETEYVILQDADLEYPVSNLYILWNNLVNSLSLGIHVDMVVARRLVPVNEVTFSGVIANRIITKLLKCPDVFSGQRIVKRNLLIEIKKEEKFLSNFTLETLLTCKALEKKLLVHYENCFYNPRGYKEGKKAKYYHMIPILFVALRSLIKRVKNI